MQKSRDLDMIRRYKPADYERVVDFIRKFGDHHILGLPERKSDVRVGFLKEFDGEIVGYSAMSLDQRYSITVVHPDWRGSGLGKRLLHRKIDWAKEKGLKYLETKVGVSNYASIGMLNKIGYEVVGLGTATTGKPTLTMRLTL